MRIRPDSMFIPQSPQTQPSPTQGVTQPSHGAPATSDTFEPGPPGSLARRLSRIIDPGGDGSSSAPPGIPPWTTKTNLPFTPSTMVLLHDGRVMAQDGGSKNWWVLTPDAKGSYASGTWSELPPMNNPRLYYASVVLKDGRVLVMGGEYQGSNKQVESNACEIFDPSTGIWTPVPPPPNWDHIGDAPCAVLPDGRVLLGSIYDNHTAIYDPVTNQWSDGGDRLQGGGFLGFFQSGGSSSEESWALMPDGSVVTVNTDPNLQGQSELWFNGQWQSAGSVPVPLVETSSQEIGPAVLMDNGDAIFFGATGHTAIYSPSGTPGQPGSWSRGPDFPKINGQQVVAKDAPATLLPNGDVLVSAAPEEKNGGFGTTTYMFLYDPSTNQLTQVDAPPATAGVAPFNGRAVLLPDGEIAYAWGSNQISFSGPISGAAAPAPVILDAPATLSRGDTVTISGLAFTGSSQAAGYGDDASQATNYPLARLVDPKSGQVYYLPTQNPSTLGVATGDKPVSVQITVPSNVPPGQYQLEVVANGEASDPVSVQVTDSANTQPYVPTRGRTPS